MTTTIALEEIKAGGTDYLPGDLLDLDVLREHAGWNDRLIDQLTRSKRIGELTQENFDMTRARRKAGTPWPPRGLSEAYLEAAGLIRPEPVEVRPAPARAKDAAAPSKAAAKKGKTPPVILTKVELTDEAVAIGDYFVQPKKNGRFTLYDATDKEGRLLRATSFRSIDSVRSFLAELSTAAGSADTSGEDSAEKVNGGDIRSSTDGGQGQNSSADR